MSLTENIGREQERISFTLFSKAAGILTKRMELADGQLVKDASGCRMSKGRAETVTLVPAEFGTFLQKLKPNQAIAHSICGHNKALIVSKAKENGARAANGLPIIVRSKEHFRYQDGPGLLMLDHDKARATCELPGSIRQPLPRPSDKQHGFCFPKGVGFACQKAEVFPIKKPTFYISKGRFLHLKMETF